MEARCIIMGQKKITPIGNKLIVLPYPKKEEKHEGLYIPETANANISEGKVIEASEEFSHLVKAGDEVIFSSGTGVGTYYQGKPHLFLQLHEVWGVLDKEA